MKPAFYILFILGIGLLSPFICIAQAQLTGQVMETSTKGVPFANVLLLHAKDSSLSKGTITNEQGFYQLQGVKQGTYILAAFMLGYDKVYSQPFFVQEQASNLKLPSLVLNQVSTELREVTIEASKPLFEQQIDRLVVNVQSSITAAGSSALDVLERSPGVSVDRQSNVLSLNGKNGVVVMINGKISRLPAEALTQLLAGMSASTIEKIELITNPSSRYDAEGDAGIIHIILKKNTHDGTNGSVELLTGYGMYEKLGGSLNLNHRSNKLNVFGEYSTMYDHHYLKLATYRQNVEQQAIKLTQNEGTANRFRRIYNARTGFDYSFNATTSIGGLIAGFDNYLRSYHNKFTNITQAGELTDYFDLRHNEYDRWQHLMANLNFRHSIVGKHEWSVDLDYLRYYNHSPNDYWNTYQYLWEDQTAYEQINVDKKTPIYSWVLKSDYSIQLRKQSKIDVGVKSTLFRLTNDITVSRSQDNIWQQDTEFSQHYYLTDDIQAAYVNVHHGFSPTLTLQSGLRYEYTFTHIRNPAGEQIVKRKYGRFFPSVFLSKEFSKKSSVQLSYSRRIGRPPYNVLAPYVFFIDPNTFTYGNPALKPAFTDALQATYRFNSTYLLSLKYSYDRDAINRFGVRFNQQEDRIFYYPENIQQVHSLAFNFTFPLQLASWWQMQNNLQGIWMQANTSQQGEDLKISRLNANINTSHTFILPAGFTGELTAFYLSPSLSGLYLLRAKGSVNVGIQKKLTSNKGTLKLSVTDLFWTTTSRVVNDIPAIDLYAGWKAWFEPRIFRLTYSRNFGKQQVKAAPKRTTGSEEERGRVN